MKKDSIAYTVIFTFVVCLLFVLPLAVANELTKARVAANRDLAERRAVLSALGLLPSGTKLDAEGIEALWSTKIVAMPELRPGLFRSSSAEGDNYALELGGAGLWGRIEAVLATDARVGRIVGLEILAHNETPGLGGRIDEAWFKAQFRGEAIKDGGFSLVQGQGLGDKDPENGRVDAITGASLTSGFVKTIVDRGIAELASLRDKGGLR